MVEAALWGRYENVEHLLEHDAQKDLEDDHGLRAIDLAKQSDQNEEERYKRSGEELQSYKENTYTANQARKMIVSLLQEITSGSQPAAVNRDFESQFLHKSASRVRLFAPIAEYEIPTSHKAIALLERGGKYSPVAAMSGWKHGKTTPLVCGKDWTSEVIRIAKIIGYTLVPDWKDKRTPGQFHACHAEKQLTAYFISKHVFLETETRDPNTYCCPEDELEADSEREYEDGGVLHELAAIAPPISLKKASILVSSAPCRDSVRFTAAVNMRLNQRIKLENRLSPA